VAVVAGAEHVPAPLPRAVHVFLRGNTRSIQGIATRPHLGDLPELPFPVDLVSFGLGQACGIGFASSCVEVEGSDLGEAWRKLAPAWRVEAGRGLVGPGETAAVATARTAAE